MGDTRAPGPAAISLKARLEKLEWSQLYFASVIGVSAPTVCRWLDGSRVPSLSKAFLIERSKIAIPASAWLEFGADESGEHAAATG